MYSGSPDRESFTQFSGALLASQIEESFLHDGVGMVPSIKDASGRWITSGHKDRIMSVGADDLSLFNRITGDADSPALDARLIQVHSRNILETIRRFSSFSSITESGVRYQIESLFHESGSQRAGLIYRDVGFPDNSSNSILSGPTIYVGNPLAKTPRAGCRHSQDYETIDLSLIPDSYQTRTLFKFQTENGKGLISIPPCDWDKTKAHTSNYRLMFRRRIDLNSERSFTAAIIAPGPSHIDALQSVSFERGEDLLTAASMLFSVPYDFLFKAIGKGDIYAGDFACLPWVEVPEAAQHRTLQLSCLTDNYDKLWQTCAPSGEILNWSRDDPRLRPDLAAGRTQRHDGRCSLRTEFARRYALMEIDVLVAQALGMTLEQLLEIYRIYFPVLQESEAGTWYDSRGKIVWTSSRSVSGVGWLDDRGKSPGRAAWEKILADNPVELTCTAIDDTMPGGPRTVSRHFTGPFTQCDRIEDYRRAWAHFERLKSEEAA